MGQVGIESSYHWLHVGSISISALACLLIASVLLYIVIRVRTLPFRFAYIGFAIFMLAMALVQAVELSETPDFFSEIDLIVSVLAALAGLVAAFTLVKTIPKIMALAKGAMAAYEHSVQLEQTCEELGTIVEKGGQEIRAQLKGIVAPTQSLLSELGSSAQYRKQLEQIQKTTDTLLKTIDDYLQDQAREAKKI